MIHKYQDNTYQRSGTYRDVPGAGDHPSKGWLKRQGWYEVAQLPPQPSSLHIWEPASPPYILVNDISTPQGQWIENELSQDFRLACEAFRNLCQAIGALINQPSFQGGYDDFLALDEEDATAIREAGLDSRFALIDNWANYEAQKIGLGRPEWWYKCWEINNAQ